MTEPRASAPARRPALFGAARSLGPAGRLTYSGHAPGRVIPQVVHDGKNIPASDVAGGARIRGPDRKYGAVIVMAPYRTSRPAWGRVTP